MKNQLLASLAGLALLATAHAGEKTLAVGDAAPELFVSEWVKGSQVSSFEKGNVYLVEFWATW